MDPRDLFRGLFGFDKHHKREKDRFLFEDEHDEQEYEDGSDIDQIFNHYHEEMFQQMQHLNQQMEEMFKTFGSFDFHSAIPSEPSHPVHPANPRDHMLKPPQDKNGSITERDPSIPGHRSGGEFPSVFGKFFAVPKFGTVQPYERVDKDLDDEINKHGLSKILPKSSPHDERGIVVPDSPRSFSHNSSVSIVTIRGADGKLEKRETVRNSDGDEVTTITRQVGDQTHSITTKKDQLGVVEEKETFQNLDKDDLKSFDDAWKSKGRQPTNPCDSMIQPRSFSQENSLFKRLFGFDFSSWNK